VDMGETLERWGECRTVMLIVLRRSGSSFAWTGLPKDTLGRQLCFVLLLSRSENKNRHPRSGELILRSL
jgi:hypothetical protein